MFKTMKSVTTSNKNDNILSKFNELTHLIVLSLKTLVFNKISYYIYIFLNTARLVFWLSINQYTSKFVKSRPDLSSQQVAYLRSTLEDAFAPLYANTSQPRWGGRVKRQVLARRVRKEIRAMTVRERRRYFAALNAIKTDTVCIYTYFVYIYLQRTILGCRLDDIHINS